MNDQETEDAITSLRQAIAEAEKQVSYAGNGTAGRENTTAPTGFFFQMPKAEQEPVAKNENGSITWLVDNWPQNCLLYTRPQPKREWVGLTDEEAQKAFAEHNCEISTHLAGILARAIEAKLKEKNNG